VFTEVGFGAVVLTINVILLGGDIVFFQALCLLGYCLFPICVSSIICAAVDNKVCGAAQRHAACARPRGTGQASRLCLLCRAWPVPRAPPQPGAGGAGLTCAAALRCRSCGR
jgi:hypothetical protein